MAWRQIRDHILHLNRSACATSTVGKKDSTVHYTSLHVMKLHFIALNYIVWHASNANAGVKYINTCSVCRLKSLFACVCIFGTELLRSKPQVKCSVKEASTRFWRKLEWLYHSWLCLFPLFPLQNCGSSVFLVVCLYLLYLPESITCSRSCPKRWMRIDGSTWAGFNETLLSHTAPPKKEEQGTVGVQFFCVSLSLNTSFFSDHKPHMN